MSESREMTELTGTPGGAPFTGRGEVNPDRADLNLDNGGFDALRPDLDPLSGGAGDAQAGAAEALRRAGDDKTARPGQAGWTGDAQERDGGNNADTSGVDGSGI